LAHPAGVSATETAFYGTNLLVNPGAEDGPAAADGSTIVDAPGWSRAGSNATVIPWQPSAGYFPAFADPGPANRGLNMFSGGASNAGSQFSQVVSLVPIAHTIDLGAVSFQLCGYLGGWSSQGDNVLFSAKFLNAKQVMIDSVVAGPVSAAERSNLTALLYRSTTGTLPAGTSSVVLTLWFTRLDGSYDDGYADSLAFTLSGTAGVADRGVDALRLALSPNPSPSGATIAYALPAAGHVRLEVLDAAGRRVALVADETQSAGAHALRWTPGGAQRDAGLYFVRLSTPAGEQVRKLVVLEH
jgi:hypothetical protein